MPYSQYFTYTMLAFLLTTIGLLTSSMTYDYRNIISRNTLENIDQFNYSSPLILSCGQEQMQNSNRGSCFDLKDILTTIQESYDALADNQDDIQNLLRYLVKSMQAIGSNDENVSDYECMLCQIHNVIKNDSKFDQICTEEFKEGYLAYKKFLCQKHLKNSLRKRINSGYDCCEKLYTPRVAFDDEYLPIATIKEMVSDVCEKEIKEADEIRKNRLTKHSQKKTNEIKSEDQTFSIDYRN